MRITILAVGRLKSGPEAELCDDYLDRFRKAGRALGFRSIDLIEVDSGGGMEAEAERLLAKLPQGAHTIRLDEHGREHRSEAFSTYIATLRDRGVPDLCFLIGGAEGYGKAIQSAVPETMAFGKQTWPHRMVRAMLAEQLYRAVSIEAGLPYHKA
ncbi:23S rRNA (pseudouridine(1915)-N(3))-methyltransferase RlmH [Henriciella mobilis]|uniref:Ribosomal RNA large subunit methyltransferase H n=1 Tax=Henriciella mobilis TaxID=2305467 RepID=A0A399RQL2_9PROT|nr:23S rRNA (pseudouridine(1915)-N(3))-methyltransferase RlmH [Henriciella mobilis]RIJ15917.1 23S rRNA (pseudouridine(1915)-N(3))-methyltransferase RlmH [Henriciella mobilis]RIJ21127.1 23S rRNA (pseudouridine(1915)-N(3))-methyltransferase RlmH [Henriciella mobilis]RIJ32633.1 23S rRNA (pseudouridine(1915)-N(3))-methyltransferase RlmH [Henriciella mobilis]